MAASVMDLWSRFRPPVLGRDAAQSKHKGQGLDEFPAPGAALHLQLASGFSRTGAFGLLGILARRGRAIAFLEARAAPRIPPLLERR